MVNVQTLHLLECNEDVLRLILGYLSKADLRAVCLVHPHLRGLAEPLLYSTIEFTWSRRFQPHPITSLVRSLLQRPELGGHIHRVTQGSRQPGKLGPYLRYEVCRTAGSTLPPAAHPGSRDWLRRVSHLGSRARLKRPGPLAEPTARP